jgi:PleD family two-component response regulator
MSSILVFHTNESTRDALRDILANRYNVIAVHDARQCLDVFEQKAPVALAFLEASSEVETETLIAKALEKKNPVIVVAVASAENENFGVNAVRCGAEGYILTPLRKDEILAIARKADPDS